MWILAFARALVVRTLGAPHGHDADLVTVLLTEQRAGPRLDRRVDRHLAGDDRRIVEDGGIGQILDCGKVVGVDRLLVREVETQAVGGDQRSLLRHVVAERQAKRLVQQVGRRMIGANGGAARVVDDAVERHADAHRTSLDEDIVHEEVAELLLRAPHEDARAFAQHDAGVADLAA